jgi:hypothetical protein
MLCRAELFTPQRHSLATPLYIVQHHSTGYRGATGRAGGSAAMNLGRTWSVWPMYPKYFCTDCHDTRVSSQVGL